MASLAQQKTCLRKRLLIQWSLEQRGKLFSRHYSVRKLKVKTFAKRVVEGEDCMIHNAILIIPFYNASPMEVTEEIHVHPLLGNM